MDEHRAGPGVVRPKVPVAGAIAASEVVVTRVTATAGRDLQGAERRGDVTEQLGRGGRPVERVGVRGGAALARDTGRRDRVRGVGVTAMVLAVLPVLCASMRAWLVPASVTKATPAPPPTSRAVATAVSSLGVAAETTTAPPAVKVVVPESLVIAVVVTSRRARAALVVLLMGPARAPDSRSAVTVEVLEARMPPDDARVESVIVTVAAEVMVTLVMGEAVETVDEALASIVMSPERIVAPVREIVAPGVAVTMAMWLTMPPSVPLSVARARQVDLAVRRAAGRVDDDAAHGDRLGGDVEDHSGDQQVGVERDAVDAAEAVDDQLGQARCGEVEGLDRGAGDVERRARHGDVDRVVAGSARHVDLSADDGDGLEAGVAKHGAVDGEGAGAVVDGGRADDAAPSADDEGVEATGSAVQARGEGALGTEGEGVLGVGSTDEVRDVGEGDDAEGAGVSGR